MLKSTAKKAASRLCVAIPGGLRFVRRLRRRSLVITMYHGVVEQSLPVFNWCQLQRDSFENQIAFLSDAYRILPVTEVIERLRRGLPLPERTASITFDDGFRSVLRTAYPILSKYQAPATVFLVTGLIGTDQMPWPERLYCGLAATELAAIRLDGTVFSLRTRSDRAGAFLSIGSHLIALPREKKEELLTILLKELGQFSLQDREALAMLSWEEVDKLNATGLVSFGSHTHTHEILSRCSPEFQRDELQTSRNLLLEHLGGADLFAYPNGAPADYTNVTKQLLVQLGYKCGLTTVWGVNNRPSDLYELQRIGIGADTSFSEFQIGMLGW
jgi:peptidoglycan/xylan/chitin deacetylase (PgdA/CDA1 family)